MYLQQTQNAELLAELNQTVHDLHVQLHPKVFKPYDRISSTLFFENMSSRIENLFYLVIIDERPSGYLWIEERNTPETPFKYASSCLYVHQISLNKDIQGKGYGKQLMMLVEELATQRNLRQVELDYWASNIGAAAFYESCAFTKQRLVVCKGIE